MEGPYSSGHLMCRTSLWGALGFLACAYFAWSAFGHVIRNSYSWPHDAWTAATYVVWIVLLTALTFDTHCWRERLFFGVLVPIFWWVLGLTVWKTAPAQACADGADLDRGALGAGWGFEFDDGGARKEGRRQKLNRGHRDRSAVAGHVGLSQFPSGSILGIVGQEWPVCDVLCLVPMLP